MRLRPPTPSVAAFALGLAAASCSPPPPAPAGRRPRELAFVDVNVVPMDRERVIAGQTVIVREGVVVALGPRAEVPVPEGAEVVAGEGGYLMPGLADMHVHLYDAEGFPSYLAHGFTTVADLNGSPEVLAHRAAIARGALLGPTLYCAGTSLNGYPPGNPLFVALESPEAARRVVAAQKAAGYDFIKVYNTLSAPTYEAVLAEAAAARFAVLGHIPWDVGAERALAGHQSNVAHMEEFVSTYFDGEPDEAKIAALTRLVAASGDYVTPNLFTFADYLRSVADLDAALADPALRYASPAALSEKLPLNNRSVRPDPAGFAARLRQGHALFQKLTKAFSDAGVPLLLGTDTEIFGQAGLAGLSELEGLVAAGLTPYQALAAATRTPGEYVARHVRPGERFGTVAPGARADLLLLAHNPLEGVGNLRSLKGLALRGRYLPAAELARAREEAARKNEPIARGVREIEALVAAKKYAEAGRSLRALVAAHPGAKVEALVVLFDYAERAGGSPGGALPFLETAAELYPWSPAAHLKLGLALARAGDEARGLECFERARALSPDDVRVTRLFERRALRGTPPAFEPAGAYAFASWVGRGARRRDVSGTLRVRAAPGGYAGTLATNLGPELPLAEVFAAGRHLWVRAVAPDGDEYELPLEIEGEAVRGRFIAGFGNNRPLSGRRLSGP